MNCYFVISGRIAVIAGENRGWAQHTEVIDLTNSSLEYDLLPDVSERFGSVGGLLLGQPLICGGYNCYDNEYLQNCVKLGHSETKFDLLEKRCGAASVVLDQKTLWVTGGEDGNDDLLTTEFISLHHSPISTYFYLLHTKITINLKSNKLDYTYKQEIIIIIIIIKY